MTENVLSSLLSQVEEDRCSGSADGDRDIGLDTEGSLWLNGFLMYLGTRSSLPRPGIEVRRGSTSSAGFTASASI